MAGSSKTSPCQLGFLPQVCQLLTIYSVCTTLLPGRALSTGATSAAWDTKTGPGRDCPTSPGLNSCRTWRATFVTEEGLQTYRGQLPGGRKKEKQPLFPLNFFQHPNLLRLPQQAPPSRVISCALRLWVAKFTFACTGETVFLLLH